MFDDLPGGADPGRACRGVGEPTRTDGAGERVLVVNPTAGSEDHVDRVRELAAEFGFVVRETGGPGDTIDLAREAAEDGARMVAAAGGDGTLNEVVRGIHEAGGLGSVTLAVIPVGTGNNFAKNVGVTGLEEAFELVESGEVRRIDVGVAGDRPFLNSCIGGLTAEASAATTSEAKARYGVLAYVLTTVRTAVAFDGLPLHIAPVGGGEADWEGDAAFVLIGNARRFPLDGRPRADVEDGLLDVTVIEDRPTFDLVGQAALERLLGAESQNVVRFRAAELAITALQAEPVTFSLDGEMIETDALSVSVRERALDVVVGEAYEPHPGG